MHIERPRPLVQLGAHLPQLGHLLEDANDGDAIEERVGDAVGAKYLRLVGRVWAWQTHRRSKRAQSFEFGAMGALAGRWQCRAPRLPGRRACRRG